MRVDGLNSISVRRPSVPEVEGKDTGAVWVRTMPDADIDTMSF